MLLLGPGVTIPSPSNPPLASLGDETVDGPIYNISRDSDLQVDDLRTVQERL